jgi:hypothetical protein
MSMPRSYIASCSSIALLASLAAMAASCGTPRGGEHQTAANLAPRFLTPVTAAQEAAVAVYWLGPDFEVDGAMFTTSQAQFPEGTAGMPVQGLEMHYSSGDEPAGTVELDLLPPTEWVVVEDKVRNPRVPGMARQTVTVAGQQAELLLLPGGARALNALWLILDLGDVVVVAQTNSGGAIYPGGPDYNPFINNPDLLVQVLNDNLRPYPE